MSCQGWAGKTQVSSHRLGTAGLDHWAPWPMTMQGGIVWPQDAGEQGMQPSNGDCGLVPRETPRLGGRWSVGSDRALHWAGGVPSGTHTQKTQGSRPLAQHLHLRHRRHTATPGGHPALLPREAGLPRLNCVTPKSLGRSRGGRKGK